MKNKSLIFCCLLGLLLLPRPAKAQWVAPWFRGGKPAWQTLTKQAFTPQRIAKTSLCRPLSTTPSNAHVKTNISNWMQYRTAYTGTLSSVEKMALAHIPENLVSTSGKLTYFHDRDQLLLTTQQELFPGMPFSETAFARHQEILELTRSEIETFAFADLSRQLYGTWMSSREATLLLADEQQPRAFSLSRSEIKDFAQLSLSQQRRFAAERLWEAQQILSVLLQTPAKNLSNDQFSTYYKTKIRAEYFHSLVTALDQAEEPFSSIIIRNPLPINLSFLPHPDEKLTDAQRLGKLYFYQDTDLFNTSEKILLKGELSHQEDLYLTYATAEAFNVPYEKLLDLYTKGIQAQDIFGQEGALRLRQLSKKEIKQRIPKTLNKIILAQQQLREQNPSPTPEIYVEYFRLAYKALYYSQKYKN